MTDALILPELEFEEKTHTYRLNGLEVPSVTTVMKPLSDSIFNGVDRDAISNAATRGTVVHQAIENFIEFGVEDIPPEYSSYLEAFKAFWMDVQPIPIATETKIYHKFLRYAGTADLLCEINGAVVLIDYKTTAQIAEMLTGVQLEAYARAYESHGIKIDAKAVLHLKKNGTYSLKWHAEDATECWSVFGALLTVRSYITKF